MTTPPNTGSRRQRQLHEANACEDVRLVRRIAVLLAIDRGEGLSQVEEQWAINHQTVYNWLAAFITRRWEAWFITNQRVAQRS